MTLPTIAEQRAVIAKATEGPWESWWADVGESAFPDAKVVAAMGPFHPDAPAGTKACQRDAAFIALARTCWPAALDRIEELGKALAGITERYIDLAESGDCGNWEPRDEDEVKAALKALNLD